MTDADQLRYSVLMSVYRNDRPDWLSVAIESMLEQSVQPSQIVLVIDGPIDKHLKAVVSDYAEDDDRFDVLQLDTNQGLPAALNAGFEQCHEEIVVRMDADDYSMPGRCNAELNLLQTEDLDFVGTNVDEFYDDINTTVSRVVLPETAEQIRTQARRRNPMRHPSMVIRAEALKSVGGYDEALLNGQDYDLVVRLLLAGYKCANVQEPLVKMRISPDFYRRRGGIAYFSRMKALKEKLYRIGFYSRSDYVLGVTTHFVSCLIPDRLREILYKRALRS